MDGLILLLPLMIPLAAAALSAMLWRSVRAQRAVGLAAAVALMAAAVALLVRVLDVGVVASQMGDWRAPFGITMVADRFAAIMVVIAATMALATTVYGLAHDALDRERAGFHPLFHGLILGVVGSFLTGDLFNLYVWFEVMLIASFGLLILGGSREQIDGALKYAVLNLIGTTVFLIGVGFLYGITGTLNMADLAGKVPLAENRGLVSATAVMLLAAFGLKAAVFPLFFWLPASYHTAPPPVAAIFAALLTKVGVYAMIRVFTLVYGGAAEWVGPVVAVVAALTMLTGVLGAAAHYDIRRILAFHIISQIGFMLLGLAVWTPLALGGAVLYIVHHIVVKANLFLIAGAIERAGGSYQLKDLGGLSRSQPLLAVLFLIPALSLAGIPPLSGFWGKLTVIRAGLEQGHGWLAGVALLVGLLTLYSMIKIWNYAFWKEPPEGAPVSALTGSTRLLMLAPIAALAAVTLTISLWAEPFVAVSLEAAAELLSPDAYIAAVLGPTAPGSTVVGALP